MLKFDIVKHEKIWGYEEWLVSAHNNGLSIISEGDFKGVSLADFYENNRELFGIKDKEFPLLIKVINAKDDLSVQVHPGDEYAKKNENSLGKTECWYVLDAKDTDIIIGLKDTNKEELTNLISKGDLEQKLNIKDVRKGDFFYIPSGVVHAIRKNTVILEVQQSSDITYRLYDYNRIGTDDNLRELHVDKSLDVIDFDYKDNNQVIIANDNDNYKEEILTNNQYFIVKKVNVKNNYHIDARDRYLIINNLTTNENFILLKGEELVIKSKCELIISTSK